MDGDIESSIVFNLEEISLHREGPNATIILLYSLPVVWFSLLNVGSYNFAAYVYRKNVLFNNRSDLDDAILDENDNSSGRYCCSRWVQQPGVESNFDHIILSSRIDCCRVSRRNLPWGRPFTLPWTRHRGGVLNAGILLLRKTLPLRSSQNIHQRKYLCEVIHAQSSILYLSEGQNSGCQMSGSVIHIYKERFSIQWFCTRI